MYSLLKIGMFHCYVSLPEGRTNHESFWIPMNQPSIIMESKAGLFFMAHVHALK